MTNNNDTSYLPTQKYPVALEHVSISGSLKNFLAELIFELDFHNCEDKNVEILYCFPLPNRAPSNPSASIFVRPAPMLCWALP